MKQCNSGGCLAPAAVLRTRHRNVKLHRLLMPTIDITVAMENAADDWQRDTEASRSESRGGCLRWGLCHSSAGELQAWSQWVVQGSSVCRVFMLLLRCCCW